jgi:hypothetical protein
MLLARRTGGSDLPYRPTLKKADGDHPSLVFDRVIEMQSIILDHRITNAFIGGITPQ